MKKKNKERSLTLKESFLLEMSFLNAYKKNPDKRFSRISQNIIKIRKICHCIYLS